MARLVITSEIDAQKTRPKELPMLAIPTMLAFGSPGTSYGFGRASGKEPADQAGAAVEHLVEQARTAVRAGRASGMNATQAMMDSYASLVSGVLIGMSEGLQPTAKAGASSARRR